MKNAVIAVIVIVALAVVAYFAYTKLMVKPLIPKGEFGYETITSVTDGKYNMGCEDAKSLVVMIDAMNKDFRDNPELGISGNLDPDNMTPSMKTFEGAMNKLGQAIETKFASDNATKEKVLNGLGESVSKIFQVSVYKHLGMIDEDNATEFVSVNFCGKTPKEGYQSPLDMDFNPAGHGDNESGEMIIEEGIEGAPEGEASQAPAAK